MCAGTDREVGGLGAAAVRPDACAPWVHSGPRLAPILLITAQAASMCVCVCLCVFVPCHGSAEWATT